MHVKEKLKKKKSKWSRPMYDWIIEADIYRLNKAAGQASAAEQRRKLETLADAKVQRLAAKQRSRSVLLGS